VRFRSRPRTFISYSHEDGDVLQQFVDLAVDGQLNPVCDKEHVGPGEELSLRIRHLIDRSDCVVCLGTKHSFLSNWCKQEVEYALETSKAYYPIALDEADPGSMPDWFRGRLLRHREVHVEHGHDGMARTVRQIGVRHSGLRTGFLVALCLLMLVAWPPILGYGVREVITMAGPVPRQWQAEIEGINASIEQAMLRPNGASSVDVRTEATNKGRAWEYRESSTGRLIARDVLEDGSLVRREFLQGRSVVAVDSFALRNTPEGKACVLKVRTIRIPNSGGAVVEDVFDSAGNLISKRVRGGATARWRQYADAGHSVYPIALLSYR